MLITLLVLGISIILFIRGGIRADLVALCGLIALMVAGILTPDEALSGFSNPVVVMMIGLFIVGGGVLQTGLADSMSKRLIYFAGTSTWKIYLFIMLATAGIGAFVSNTGTVALMMPVVVSLAVSANLNPSRLLMPIAFASSMGGMMTLIGTPPNLIISNELVKAGYAPLGFFTFSKVGIIIVLVGIIALWFLSKKFLNLDPRKDEHTGKFKSTADLVREYHLSEGTYCVSVPRGSGIIGNRLDELNIVQRFNLIVLKIERKSDRKRPFSKNTEHKLASPSLEFEYGDRIYLRGKQSDIQRFIEDFFLKTVVKKDASSAGEPNDSSYSFGNIGIAEVVVLSNSRMVNKKVRDTAFRENFGLNILGIQRNNRYLLENLKDEKLHAGDAILIQGDWENISRLDQQMLGLVVIGQPLKEASKVRIDEKAPLAALIMLGMVALMVLDILPAVTAVMLAAIVMVLAGCLRNVEAAFQTINWESVLLIGSMMPMALALEKTGVSDWVAGQLTSGLGDLGPIYLLGGIYLVTSMLTLFINNTATAVLLAPLAIQVSQSMDLSPYPFLFAVTIAASMCFASPFSTPPNALVMSAGRYTFLDYVRVGLPLQLLFFVLMTLLLPRIFPF